MARSTDARERAIAAAENLFRAQGYAATGLTQIIEESGSPKGSFYFHFPGGKRQLGIAALQAFGVRTVAVFAGLAEKTEGDPRAFVRLLLETVAHDMELSAWRSNCLAQVMAQELAPFDEEIAGYLAELFGEWTDLFATALGGTTAARAQATALLASIEGARTLARTQRSRDPFTAVTLSFHAMLRSSDDPAA